MKPSHENGDTELQDKTNRKKKTAQIEKKFTKEYKSPQHSRFKMAYFTEIVKNKSQGKNGSFKSSSGAKQTTTKVKPKYSYVSSKVGKPQPKPIKQREVDPSRNNVSVGKRRIQSTVTSTIGKTARKATSTQKERSFKSTKLTSGIPGRLSGVRSNYKARETLLVKRPSTNSHQKKGVMKRPTTATSNKHNFGAKERNSMLNKTTDGFSKTITKRNNQMEGVSKAAALARQRSDGNKIHDIRDYDESPGLVEHNEGLAKHSAYKHYSMKTKPYLDDDPSYRSVERNFSRKKQSSYIHDDLSSSATPASSSKGRATTTPFRHGFRNRAKVFKIEPEAFQQPDIDEADNLVVNLEDIVKEEQVIFSIQECLSHQFPVEKYCNQWWETTNVSSVKEMQLFFEEESSKKLIRQQQILLLLVIGYIELMEEPIKKSHKTLASIKNIMTNVHKNYLVFVEFICKNLNYEQRTKTKEWVDELYRILEERPAAKTYYKCNNTQTLIRNNELSQNLLKGL